MRTSFLKSIWFLAAGCALAALADAMFGFSGLDIPRAFTVSWLGACLASAPVLAMLLLPAMRSGEARTLGPFLAGLWVGCAPFLADASLPMLVAGIITIGAGCFTILRMKQSVPGGKVIALLPIAAVLLVAYSFVLGKTDGRPEVVRTFPQRSDPIPESRPDILLISIDTLRADALIGPRPDGYTLPTFDAMREAGASADFAHSSSGLTLPGHLTMLTGQDSLTHGVRSNFNPVPANQPWVSEHLRKAGYRTAGVISNGLLSSDIGFGEGFEVFDDSDVPLRGRVRRFAQGFAGRGWIDMVLPEGKLLKLIDLPLFRGYRTNKGTYDKGRATRTNKLANAIFDDLYEDERPYFFFLHYMDPHDPYGTIAPFAGSLTKDLPPLPERLPVDPNNGLLGDAAILLEKDLQSGDPERIAEAKQAVHYFHMTYLEEVAFMDQQVGLILERMEQSGRPTVVLLTGDHGEHFGEHDLMKHGNSLFGELINVPFLITGPGVPAGARFEQDVQLLDIYPTLLGLSGLLTEEDVERMQGTPLVLQGKLQESNGPRIAIDGKFFSLRVADEKWIGAWAKQEAPEHKVDFLGLYNLRNDPQELQSLGEAAAANLSTVLAEALARDKHDGNAEVSAAQAGMGAELGYVGDVEEDLPQRKAEEE